MSHSRHLLRNTHLTGHGSCSCEQLELRLFLAAANPIGDQRGAESQTETAFAGAAEFSDVPDIGTADNWNVNAVRAPEAWSHGFTGQGVVVAIIDSGVDGTNSALQGQVWSNVGEIAGNGRDDDGNGFVDDTSGWDFVDGDNHPDDESGHGTLVAGIVAGRQSEGNVIGIAPGTKIMPIRVLDGRDTATNSGIAAGIRYAAESGADIINLSIGGRQNASVRTAIEYALSQDVLVVAAAGNDAAVSPTYPAAYSATLPNLLSVGAYRATGSLGGFSNDVGASGAVQVDAPGINILSVSTGGRAMYQSGTSMAAPHAAAIAALALSANPNLSAAELRNLIVAGAEPSIAGSDSRGAVNAARTVAAAIQRNTTIAATAITMDSSQHEPGFQRLMLANPPPSVEHRAEDSRRNSGGAPRAPLPDFALRATQDAQRSMLFAWLAQVWQGSETDNTEVDAWLDEAFFQRTATAARFSHPSRFGRLIWR